MQSRISRMKKINNHWCKFSAERNPAFFPISFAIYDWLKVPQFTLFWLDLRSIKLSSVWRKNTLCYVKPQVFSNTLFWVATTLWWFTLPPVQKSFKRSLNGISNDLWMDLKTGMGCTKDKSNCTYVT